MLRTLSLSLRSTTQIRLVLCKRSQQTFPRSALLRVRDSPDVKESRGPFASVDAGHANARPLSARARIPVHSSFIEFFSLARRSPRWTATWPGAVSKQIRPTARRKTRARPRRAAHSRRFIPQHSGLQTRASPRPAHARARIRCPRRSLRSRPPPRRSTGTGAWTRTRRNARPAPGQTQEEG